MNKTVAEQDWNPEAYASFQSVRLRPALDLLSRVAGLPDGDVIDLGCGNGAVGPALKRRFEGRRLIGVDNSPAMLKKARYSGAYTELKSADALEWMPEKPPALIFSNALCHWLPDHSALFERYAAMLAPGGGLAVQMPRQFQAASHALLRVTAEALFPEKFDYSDWVSPVAPAADYHRMLGRFGAVSAWETDYVQHLKPGKMGHPVLEFTESTAMRPITAALTESEQVQFLVTYGESLKDAYPLEADGSVLMPMKRVFFTLNMPA